MNEPTRSPRSQQKRTPLHYTKKAKLNQLLVGIRSTPNATAKMNKSSITCLLSSTQDKLYAGIDARKKRFYLTYRVEPDKENHSTLVQELFNECSQDIPCAQVTTGKFYTQISLNEDVALMNLLISRLTKKTRRRRPRKHLKPRHSNSHIQEKQGRTRLLRRDS